MMETVMAQREPGPGELAWSRKRRRLRWIVAVGVALGVGLGAALGQNRFLFGPTESISPTLAIAGTIFLIAGILGGTWFYFRQTDELDVRDNLIAGNVALYFYAIAYPCWLLLARGGLVPRTDGEVLYVATLVVLCLAYFWKRLRP